MSSPPPRFNILHQLFLYMVFLRISQNFEIIRILHTRSCLQSFLLKDCPRSPGHKQNPEDKTGPCAAMRSGKAHPTLIVAHVLFVRTEPIHHERPPVHYYLGPCPESGEEGIQRPITTAGNPSSGSQLHSFRQAPWDPNCCQPKPSPKHTVSFKPCSPQNFEGP